MGMGKDLYDRFPEARRVFDDADSILRFPLSKLCFEGPEEELVLTSNTQPALFATSIACLRLLEKHGVAADVTAGHSIGEYAALVAAGVLEFEDALPLVRKRGELMQEAGRKCPGTMAAIIGLDADEVEVICSRADDAGIVDIANYNSPGQVVISGEVKAVEAASQYAKEAGARKVIPLSVSGAFHSRLMSDAAERLAVELNHACFDNAAIPIVANVTADYVYEADDIRDCLERQIAGSVRWEESVRLMVDDGVTLFIELGAGKVLSGLIKRIADGVEVASIGDTASYKAFIGRGE